MKNILIDTDLCCDCDDALALALANICHNKGEINLLGVTHCFNDNACAHFVKKINEYYHNNIPVGKSNCCVFDYKETKKYFIDILTDGDSILDYPCSLDITLEQLYSNFNVTLVYIGQLNNLAQLIELSEVKYKGCKIGDLLRTRVCEIVVMAGEFSIEKNENIRPEFNVIKDLQSAKKVFAEDGLPPITVLDSRQGGNVLTGAAIKSQTNNPAGQAYQLFCDKICGTDLRPSWDPLAILYAIFGVSDVFSLSKKGKIFVAETGITTFQTGKGEHRLLKVLDKEQSEKWIEEISQ